MVFSRRGEVRCRSTSPYSGCASRSSTRRSRRSETIRPFRSTAERASASTIRSGVSTPRGSPKASSSRTACSSASREPMRASMSSVRRGEGTNGPFHRQTSSSMSRAPLARPPSTSSRRNNMFPRLSSQRWCSVAPSTCPPSTWRTRSSDCPRASPWMSMRSARPSFHSAKIGSGTVTPVRAVTTTVAAPVTASWWISAAEVESSRWASSTASRRRRPPACSTRWRAACGRRWAAWEPGPSQAARSWPIAPSGMPDADRVAMTHRTAAPAASARSATARASRVLPTPGGPTRTTPVRCPSSSALRTAASSRSRPTNGQCRDILLPSGAVTGSATPGPRCQAGSRSFPVRTTAQHTVAHRGLGGRP